MKINIPNKEEIINIVSKEILGVEYNNKFIEEAVDKILTLFEYSREDVEKSPVEEIEYALRDILLETEWSKPFQNLMEWATEFSEFVDERMACGGYSANTLYELLLIAYNDFLQTIGDIIVEEIVG